MPLTSLLQIIVQGNINNYLLRGNLTIMFEGTDSCGTNSFPVYLKSCYVDNFPNNKDNFDISLILSLYYFPLQHVSLHTFFLTPQEDKVAKPFFKIVNRTSLTLKNLHCKKNLIGSAVNWILRYRQKKR